MSNLSLLNDSLESFCPGLSSELSSTVEQALLLSVKNGAEFAEFFFEETIGSRILLENKKLDKIVEGTDRGVGFRVVAKGRSISGYTTVLKDFSLLNLATNLSKSLAQAVPEVLKNRPAVASIPWSETKNGESSIQNYKIAGRPRAKKLNSKIDFLRRAEVAARAILPEIKQVTSFYLDQDRKILVINSDGSIAKDQKTYLQMSVEVVAEKDGKVESSYETDGGFVGFEFFESRTPESIGVDAARRASVLLSARQAPSGTLPVVLSSSAGGTMIHEAVGHGLEADLACNGLSIYQGKLGQKVASELVTVIDDGTLPGKRGSYRIDDEGNPSRKNVLIENGVLKSFMVDRISAFKFDLMVTGNGRRESFRHKPIVRMTNTYIAPGKDDPDEILKSTARGVFVKAMGGGEVNTVTGDFVFAVTEGYLINHGKIGDAIRGATLVGNGPKVLSIVDRVGSDLGFSTGTCGKDGQAAPVTDAQPTLRIPELTVGGEIPLEQYPYF